MSTTTFSPMLTSRKRTRTSRLAAACLRLGLYQHGLCHNCRSGEATEPGELCATCRLAELADEALSQRFATT
jgi:hypothetical protein